jgi:uncharacterized membrane protein YdfJ with MMPL/SSD domain
MACHSDFAHLVSRSKADLDYEEDKMGSTTQRLATASARRPWLVVGLWITTIAIAGVLASQFLADALTTEVGLTNDPEATRANELIEERFGEAGETEVFILSSTQRG